MDDHGVRPLIHRRLGRGELIVLDGAAAAGYVALVVSGAFGPPPALTWPVGAALTATAAPLVFRRVWPLAVLGVVFVAAVAAVPAGLSSESVLCIAYALYPVALSTPRHPREPTVVIGAFSVVVLIFGVLGGVGTQVISPVQSVVVSTLVLAGAWTLGRATRERRAYAKRSAEQDAARAVERAVAGERLRIARELHDVVSHTISLIGVKAAVARHVASTNPAEVRDALGVIDEASRNAMTEMRRMLGVLRLEGDAAEADPAPRLEELAGLTAWATDAGVTVDLTLRGQDRVPQGLVPSVHRIVQEALTNTVRHAAPTRCRIVVEGTATDVRVEVVDDGPGGGGDSNRGVGGGPARGLGLGLVGMRERVALHGGELSAGRRPGGGFAVTAQIPCAPCAPAP